jgi:hypothetical protein
LPVHPPAFHLRLLANVPVDRSKPWYTRAPIGVDNLKNILPEISEAACIGVQYTNHSVHSTAITRNRMYESGVPEKWSQVTEAWKLFEHMNRHTNVNSLTTIDVFGRHW